eukprot:TRINITY_DN4003_c0_g1_i1.p1 TRINITY_DN4003_c0_g1~~TRINITY_DN4003_c0_g1_i1.p1  ORF type:complete len:593 (-),score=145.35 TRINITY_DN4003_c0_g1_i1:105-1883(-)
MFSIGPILKKRPSEQVHAPQVPQQQVMPGGMPYHPNAMPQDNRYMNQGPARNKPTLPPGYNPAQTGIPGQIPQPGPMPGPPGPQQMMPHVQNPPQMIMTAEKKNAYGLQATAPNLALTQTPPPPTMSQVSQTSTPGNKGQEANSKVKPSEISTLTLEIGNALIKNRKISTKIHYGKKQFVWEISEENAAGQHDPETGVTEKSKKKLELRFTEIQSIDVHQVTGEDQKITILMSEKPKEFKEMLTGPKKNTHWAKDDQLLKAFANATKPYKIVANYGKDALTRSNPSKISHVEKLKQSELAQHLTINGAPASTVDTTPIGKKPDVKQPGTEQPQAVAQPPMQGAPLKAGQHPMYMGYFGQQGAGFPPTNFSPDPNYMINIQQRIGDPQQFSMPQMRQPPAMSQQVVPQVQTGMIIEKEGPAGKPPQQTTEQHHEETKPERTMVSEPADDLILPDVIPPEQYEDEEMFPKPTRERLLELKKFEASLTKKDGMNLETKHKLIMDVIKPRVFDNPDPNKKFRCPYYKCLKTFGQHTMLKRHIEKKHKQLTDMGLTVNSSGNFDWPPHMVDFCLLISKLYPVFVKSIVKESKKVVPP